MAKIELAGWKRIRAPTKHTSNRPQHLKKVDLLTDLDRRVTGRWKSNQVTWAGNSESQSHYETRIITARKC